VEIPRVTIKKCVIDYTINTQECTLTLYYGFAETNLQDYEAQRISDRVLAFWQPKLQDLLVDSGQVGGCRTYSPHRRQLGTGASHGGTPTTDEVTQNMAGSVALLFRCFQQDRPARLQKRVYLPCGREDKVVNGLWDLSGAYGTIVDAFRGALSTRLEVPGVSPSTPAIPCIRSTTVLGGATALEPRYYSIEDATTNPRPAQRRSRQLSNQFSWSGAAQEADPELDDLTWTPTPNTFDYDAVPLLDEIEEV